MSKFVDNFKKFTFVILMLYVVTVPVSSTAAEAGFGTIFQQLVNVLTVFTTLLLLMSAFFQYRADPESLKTESYLVNTAVIYFIICLASAFFAEANLEHCLTRVFTLFCFLNNSFWPHILFPKIKHSHLLTRTVIYGSLALSVIFSYTFVIRNGSFSRYDYNNIGDIVGLPDELGLHFDPNIMLFAFIYGIVCLFILYSEKPLPSLWQKVVVTAQGLIMLFFLFVLFSRTTAISLALTVLLYLGRRFYKDHRFWICIGILIFIVIISLPELTELINKSEFYANLTEGREISNEDRVFRLEYSVNLWLSSVKSIIIGRGYGIEILEYDPHNIYLTHAYSNGLMGFFAFMAFVFSIKIYGNKLTPKETSVIDLSMIYIGIGATTYWHNKSMWVIFMLCLMYTRAYRSRHQIPTTTTFDFDDHPVTQFGSRVSTFLTGFVKPKSKPTSKQIQRLIAQKKRRKANKRKVQLPAWAMQERREKSAFDFEEHPLTRLGSRVTTFLTGLVNPRRQSKPQQSVARQKALQKRDTQKSSHQNPKNLNTNNQKLLAQKQRQKIRKRKVQVPAWAIKEESSFDFDPNPITRLGKRLTGLFTGLKKSPESPPPLSKKMQEMKRMSERKK